MSSIRAKADCRHQGFSLVELSVVCAIMAVVIVMGLDGIAMFVNRTAYQTTQDKLVVIKKALAKHRYVYGYLPCPANMGVNYTNSTYGKETRDGTGACNSSNALTNTLVGGAVTKDSILFGDVPVRDLELPLSYMKDGYNDKLRYVVVSGFTSSDASTYTSTSNGIIIRTGQLESTCSTVCQDIATAAYVVLSFGADKRGAVNGPPCAMGNYYAMIDSANCQFNAGSAPSYSITSPTILPGIFYDSRYNAGTNTVSHDDDVIIWQTKGQL